MRALIAVWPSTWPLMSTFAPRIRRKASSSSGVIGIESARRTTEAEGK
jgi:hypothetical protein